LRGKRRRKFYSADKIIPQRITPLNGIADALEAAMQLTDI